MIRVEHSMDIKDLKKQGHSLRAIVELTGLSRNTVRKGLRDSIRSKRPLRALTSWNNSASVSFVSIILDRKKWYAGMGANK